jgi:hypothetical protein
MASSDGEMIDLTPKTEGVLGEVVEPTLPRSGAENVAFAMGLIKQGDVYGEPKLFNGKLLPTIRGRKALVGQYIEEVMGPSVNPVTKELDYFNLIVHQRIDKSEVINASVKGAIKLPVRKAQPTIQDALNETPQAS